MIVFPATSLGIVEAAPNNSSGTQLELHVKRGHIRSEIYPHDVTRGTLRLVKPNDLDVLATHQAFDAMNSHADASVKWVESSPFGSRTVPGRQSVGRSGRKLVIRALVRRASVTS